MKVLETKELYMSFLSIHTTLFYEASMVLQVDIILMCIKSFPKGTTGGIDYLQAQHILHVIYGEGSVAEKYMLYVINLIVNLWLGGKCPTSL